jgi:myo-inositol-1(or 4)-monophosphatase
MAAKSALINVMAGAARKAARGLIRDFGEVENLQVSRKGPADFVSQADLKAERIVASELDRARPDWGLVLEEGEAKPSKDGRHRFFVDPLDGTTNFLHGLPHFAISIGLERDGELAAGVILDPIKDELFWAERGIGAFLNDRRLRVSSRERLPDALLATGIPFRGTEGHERFQAELAAISPEVAGVRRWGSAAT